MFWSLALPNNLEDEDDDEYEDDLVPRTHALYRGGSNLKPGTYSRHVPATKAVPMLITAIPRIS